MNDKKITRREAIKKTVNTSVAAGTLAKHAPMDTSGSRARRRTGFVY